MKDKKLTLQDLNNVLGGRMVMSDTPIRRGEFIHCSQILHGPTKIYTSKDVDAFLAKEGYKPRYIGVK